MIHWTCPLVSGCNNSRRDYRHVVMNSNKSAGSKGFQPGVSEEKKKTTQDIDEQLTVICRWPF